MKNQLYKKSILSLSDNEIMQEISEIVGHRVTKTKKDLGWITYFESDYFRNGQVNNEDLYNLYKNGPCVEEYITTLAITSLRNRPKDLFALIKKQKPSNKVLEYGCGVSTHGVACAQLGCDVHIVDISERMLEVAKQRYILRGLQYTEHKIKGDFPEFEKNFFDTIICTDVVEHVPYPINLLKHFIGWLKVGGSIHLHVSGHINLHKGHLPSAINVWKKTGVGILKRRFIKTSDHNFILKG